jgi:NAD(P)H-dependent FMN reductase
MLKIAVILGSIRPDRVGEAVAKWVLDVARQRDDAEFELVGIADYMLRLDEAMPPAGGVTHAQPHNFAWAEKIASSSSRPSTTTPPPVR